MKIVPTIPSHNNLVNVVYTADEVLNQTAKVFTKDANQLTQFTESQNKKLPASEKHVWYEAFQSYAACIAGFLKLKPNDDFISDEDWTLQNILELKLRHEYGLDWFYDIVVSEYVIEYPDASQLKIASSKI